MMAVGDVDGIDEIIAHHLPHDAPAQSALLPILHSIQAARGCISEDTVRTIASRLNMTRAEVHGVVSFYHDFRAAPAPLPVLKLCRAEACKARGVEALIDDAEQAAEGKVEIETVYCLGLCSVGPAALVDQTIHAALNAEKLRALIGAIA